MYSAMIETAAAKPRPWDSHGTEISGTLQASSEPRRFSDLSLQRGNWESLHDSPGWLRLDLDLLTESHPDSCLGGWLDASLDPAEARDGEDASLLHFSGGEGGQAFKEARANLGLHLMLFIGAIAVGMLRKECEEVSDHCPM